jgi:hypothetical protein
MKFIMEIIVTPWIRKTTPLNELFSSINTGVDPEAQFHGKGVWKSRENK